MKTGKWQSTCPQFKGWVKASVRARIMARVRVRIRVNTWGWVEWKPVTYYGKTLTNHNRLSLLAVVGQWEKAASQTGELIGCWLWRHCGTQELYITDVSCHYSIHGVAQLELESHSFFLWQPTSSDRCIVRSVDCHIQKIMTTLKIWHNIGHLCRVLTVEEQRHSMCYHT